MDFEQNKKVQNLSLIEWQIKEYLLVIIRYLNV